MIFGEDDEKGIMLQVPQATLNMGGSNDWQAYMQGSISKSYTHIASVAIT